MHHYIHTQIILYHKTSAITTIIIFFIYRNKSFFELLFWCILRYFYSLFPPWNLFCFS